MIVLNLTANGTEQNLIKEFLQNNVNEVLADKINNGVKLTKGGKTLLNKKTLDGFMNYACKQAKELAKKGTNFACVHHDTVFGWAMHYFEENDIEGTLYNEDGTEYKPVIKKPSKPPVTAAPTPYVPPVKKPEPQMSFFDLLSPKEEPKKEPIPSPVPEQEEPTQEDLQEALSELQDEKPEQTPCVSNFYKKYMEIQEKNKDAIILIRLGDFYEVLGDNAIKIANLLDLTLTGRDCGLKERVPMIGFPYHARDIYFKKISVLGTIIVSDNNTLTVYDKQSETYSLDKETGEIINQPLDNAILDSLQRIFGNTMEIRL